jgi:hypothetical protein
VIQSKYVIQDKQINKDVTSYQQNKGKKKYMIISIYVEKELDKIQYLVMIKAVNKLRIERSYVNII